MGRKLRVSLAQLSCVEGDKEANLSKLVEGVHDAARRGADMVVFPEMYLTGYPPTLEVATLAEPVEGESLQRVARVARQHGIHVVVGFPELDASTSAVYNSAAFIDRTGQVVSIYRKTHLFRDEGKHVEPGQGWEAFEVEGVKYGLLVCFDLEFPEPPRALALEGAEVLLVLSANMVPYAHYHRVFVAARALENHMFVVYCNRAGSSSRYDYVGESAIADPLGRMVCLAGPGPQMVVGEVDLDLIPASQPVFNYFHERRPEMYQSLILTP